MLLPAHPHQHTRAPCHPSPDTTTRTHIPARPSLPTPPQAPFFTPSTPDRPVSTHARTILAALLYPVPYTTYTLYTIHYTPQPASLASPYPIPDHTCYPPPSLSLLSLPPPPARRWVFRSTGGQAQHLSADACKSNQRHSQLVLLLPDAPVDDRQRLRRCKRPGRYPSARWIQVNAFIHMASACGVRVPGASVRAGKPF